MRIAMLSCLCGLFINGIGIAQDGAAVYNRACAPCHDKPAGRVPARTALEKMSSAAIIRSLESGPMRLQAKALTSNERIAVATYLGGGFFSAAATAPEPPPSAFCTGSPSTLNMSGPAWNGFGAGLANTRFQPEEAAGIRASEVPRLRVKWAFSLGDVTLARGQPVAFGGRVFAASQAKKIFALDARSGCLYWVFDTAAPVRSGVVVGAAGKDGRPAIYFGDAAANAYGVDAVTGNALWKVRADDHYAAVITDAPQYYDGVVYLGLSSTEELTAGGPTYECCTFRGSVVTLDAATGKQIWKTYTVPPPKRTNKTKAGTQRWGPSGAGVWSTPTIDVKRNAIYVATGDNYSDPPTNTSDAVVAFDVATGRMLWSRQMTPKDAFTVACLQPEKTNCPDSNGPDLDFGQSPILVALPNGKRALVVGQKSGVAHAVDPDQQGEVLWQTRLGKGGPLGGIQWGSAADSNHMYVALSDVVFTIKNPATFQAELDPNAGGGLFALALKTGEKAWSAKPFPCGDRKECSPAQSAAVTAIPGVVFSGSMDGHLRAYSTADGTIVWDLDTAQEYDAVNGGKARGGAMDAGGPAIAGGMMFVYSGYGQWGGRAGNVLLALSVDGK